jgi:virginiamycin B lyase
MEGLAVRKQPLILAIICTALLLAACGTKYGALGGTQYHTPLECPCPTIAPLATYQLPSELPFKDSAYLPGLVTGSDGNLWVIEYDADKLARVTVSGTIDEFPLPAAFGLPGWIIAGPDGNLWIGQQTATTTALGRVTTSGVVTEFPLPAPLDAARDAQGNGLTIFTAGPDGNIWFSHDGANIIGVMSTSGTLLKTYPIPTANSEPDFIIKGPDGNMWFEEHLANKIGRLNIASGHIDEFPIPTPNSYPRNIIIGPDGNMWFPEASVGQVARLTTAGVITEFLVESDRNHWLTRVAVAPDGSMWLVDSDLRPPWASEVAKFDINGVKTDLWSYPNGFPRGLGIGPDGSPWFTDEGNDLVVRL